MDLSGFLEESQIVFQQNNSNNTNGSSEGNITDSREAVIWDAPEVQITFIVLYSVVFFTCFFGNLTVILVVTIHWRMRSITNFCLANLAFADFCVGIFCVYQNLYIILGKNWIFGSFACKMYYFVNEMAHTASVLILVVICVERYLAIIHPMKCKDWLTLNRLRLTVISVWTMSGIYSSPRLYYTETITHESELETEIICTPNQTKYNSQLFDQIHMGILFFLPLLAITILYSIIGITLWKSSKCQLLANGTETNVAPPSESSSSSNDGIDDNDSVKLGRRCGGRRSRKGYKRDPSCLEILCCFNLKNAFSTKSSPEKKLELFELQELTPNVSIEPRISPNIENEDNGNRIPINSNEPIVVVRFDESKKSFSSCNGKGSKRKNRAAQCTIVINEPTKEQKKSESVKERHLENPQQTPLTLSVKNSLEEFSSSTKIQGATTATRDVVPNSNRSVSSSSLKNRNDMIETQLKDKTMPLGSVTNRRNATRRGKRQVLRGGNKYGHRALQARRKIIKMLVIIVLSFTLCNLPYHSRKLWQIFGNYRGGSLFSTLFTPITFLILYAASSINPILYAFFSHKFRQSLSDLLQCRSRRTLRKPVRNFSLRSTNVVQLNYSVT